MAADKQTIFLVGAGVVGLSTAIRALEAGFSITVFAEIFPGDKKSIKYTSCWAAANHISVAATNSLLHQMERETFPVLLELITEDSSVPVMVRPHQELAEKFGPEIQQKVDHLTQCYPDFRILAPSELPTGAEHGCVFSTVCMDAPRYLIYLLEKFFAMGGKAFRVTLPSLSALLSEADRPALQAFPSAANNGLPGFNPAGIINCTGIGALLLDDVSDSNVYPTRGEVLIIRAPWINHGLSYYWADGHVSYVIPRRSGDAILGGTFQPDDWHPTSRPETVKLIKDRGIKAYPELLPTDKRASGTTDDLDVIEECVGLRPTRRGGVRLETSILSVSGKEVPVVHNYGHGGAGYQSSWGSAKMAVDLLKEAVKL